MDISRNAPCPCGSGRKYKKCCLGKTTAAARPSPRFRFESGSYGNPAAGLMPSALCYEQVAPGQWTQYDCLVNPTAVFATHDEATNQAHKDLDEAAAAKRAGSDADFALVLKNKGYKRVDHFQWANDEPTP